jgi:hypothetical protein
VVHVPPGPNNTANVVGGKGLGGGGSGSGWGRSSNSSQGGGGQQQMSRGSGCTQFLDLFAGV